MHLLKNFGTGGTNTAAKTAGTTAAGKTSYFSSLNLASQNEKEKKKEKQVKKTQGPPKGFIPQRFALDFDHPTIILEYKDPQSQKLYHHKMAIKKLKRQTPTKQALDYLKKKHYHYFIPKVIDQAQIQKLIEKLKNGLIGDQTQQLGDVDEEDLDFDYQEDFDA